LTIADLSGQFGPTRLVPKCPGSEVSWVRSVRNSKQQYLLHMSDNMVNFGLLTVWDLLASLGNPCKFQRVSRLGSVTARAL